MTEIKFCINCKHLSEFNGSYLCKRPKDISLVTGQPTINFTLAEVERTCNHTGCGQVGKYFEPTEIAEHIEIHNVVSELVRNNHDAI